MARFIILKAPQLTPVRNFSPGEVVNWPDDVCDALEATGQAVPAPMSAPAREAAEAAFRLEVRNDNAAILTALGAILTALTAPSGI